MVDCMLIVLVMRGTQVLDTGHLDMSTPLGHPSQHTHLISRSWINTTATSGSHQNL